MSTDNPDAAPRRDWIDADFAESGQGKRILANRLTRLGAVVMDGLIGLVVAFPVIYLLGIWSYAAKGENPPLGVHLLSIAYGVVAFLLIDGYLLKTRGRTVGKMLRGIRIVDRDGKIPTIATLLLRYLSMMIPSGIPAVGPVPSTIDVLFIFRSDRRRVHDLIADTRVVEAKSAG